MIHDLYEKNALAKLFFNVELRDKYLPSMLTSLFQKPHRRLAAFGMKLLHEKGQAISIETLVMVQSSDKIKTFRWKHHVTEVLSVETLTDMLYDMDVDNSVEQFSEIWKELHTVLWNTRVTDTIQLMHKNKSPRNVLPLSKGLQRIHRVIYKHKYTSDGSQIASAVIRMNSSRRMLPFFSDDLNELVGGWTCGYPNAIIGRGGHAKSTMMSYDTIWKLDNGIIDKADVILCEEDIVSFWSRVFAYKFNIPMPAIRNGTVTITPEQTALIEKQYSGRLNVYSEVTKFADVVDIIFSSTADYIWIDHVNGIEYPGRGSTMQNMIGGIPTLLAREKEYLQDRRDSALVNLCQVNEKVMAQNLNLWKMPKVTDAYGGTTVNQAAREVLCTYYPFKDVIEEPERWVGKMAKKPHGEKDLYVSVGKSNLGRTGEVRLGFENDYGSFGNVKIPEVRLKGVDEPSKGIQLSLMDL